MLLSQDSQELPLDRLLDLVRGKLYKQYRTHSERDDLVQEGVIYAWRKNEAGGSDYAAFGAGKDRARNLVYSLRTGTGDTYTGKPVNAAAKRKQSNGDASREKIRAYVDTYARLHDAPPSPTKIASATGISRTTVRFHLNRLHMFDGAPESRPGTLSIDASMGGDEESDTWAILLPPVPSAENEIVDRLDLQSAVADLPPRDKEYLYKEFWEDKTYVQIAKEFNVGEAYVNKLRKQVLGRVKEAMETVN